MKTPPLPGDAEERDRRSHAAKRRRILTGQWAADLRAAVEAFFSAETAQMLDGTLDRSKNVLGRTATEIAVQYHRAPLVSAEDGDEASVESFAERMEEAGFWQLAQDNQRMTWGVREGLMRLDYVLPRGRLQLRSVPVDLVFIESDIQSPDEPIRVTEARVRSIARGGKARDRWTWDVVDISDAADPTYRVLLPPADPNSNDDPEDITEEILGGEFDGPAFPWRIEGVPVLPYLLYHARRTGRLWDPWRNSELVEGTLRVGVYYTHLGFLIRDCAHPQRWLADAVIDGTEEKGSGAGKRKEVHVNPASILTLRSTGVGGIQSGQWEAGADPERVQLTIREYERSILLDAGLETDDTQRNGAPQSGWAIALKRSSVREKQMEMEPNFRQVDEFMMSLAAALLNEHEAAGLPESGWSITYRGLPLSPVEVETRTKQAMSDIELGIASPVDLVLASNIGWTRDQGKERLREIRQENAEFSNRGAGP